MVSRYHKTVRLCLIAMALFPTLWGVLGFLNNVSGFDGTLNHAVQPLIAMKDTYGLASQTWRAIDSMVIAEVSLILITGIETLAGLMGIIAIAKMLLHLNSDASQFEEAKIPLLISSLLAVMIWGIGFMVIAGDYFLAWQGKTALSTQLGAMIYAIPCFLTMIFAVVHRE